MAPKETLPIGKLPTKETSSSRSFRMRIRCFESCSLGSTSHGVGVGFTAREELLKLQERDHPLRGVVGLEILSKKLLGFPAHVISVQLVLQTCLMIILALGKRTNQAV